MNTPVSRSTRPEPIIPDYLGANVRGIVPALLGPSKWSSSLPDWMPAVLREASQVVFLVLDGLGWDQLQDHVHVVPTIAGLQGGPISTVAPTTTATALSSIATGLTPGEHGLIGYRMLLGGEVINVLRWAVDGKDRRRSQVPSEIQPFDAFLGNEVPVVSPAELGGSAFTQAHLRGGRHVGYRSPSSIAVEVKHLLEAGERFVYAYYGGIDKIAHERGFGAFYDAELRLADHLVEEVLDALPPGAALLITADHGQVQTGEQIYTPSAELLADVTMQSGEGRFRWLHARRGAVDSVAAIAEAEFGHLAWVRTKEQMIDEKWFGPTVAPPVSARLGDVAIASYEPVSFHDPNDGGPFQLVCRHGSMTSAEVMVPLIAAISSK